MSYLVPQQPSTFNTTIERFDPIFWDVDFNLSAIATITTTGSDSFHVEGILRSTTDLVGLFWRSKDKFGHPLFSYQQNVDWRNCVLSFDLVYTACPVINESANRLTMTVTDMSGKAYFVYLENFITSGSPSGRNASFSIDFNTAMAGVLADETVPWDFIDNIFIGWVPPGYNGPLGPSTPIADLAFTADMTNITVTGSNSTVGYNDAGLAAHDLEIADGYADSYPLTPARVVDQIVNLGYRGDVTLYVGFTQFLSLTYDSGEARFKIDTAKDTINTPSSLWVTDFCERLDAEGIGVIMSVSFELLNQFVPYEWCQYDYKGDISESGWTPSSSFVSPSSVDGMNYLRDVAVEFVKLGVDAGATTGYQVGEPWWWPGGFNDNGPCFYDPFVQAEYLSDTGLPVPTPFLQTIFDEYEDDADQVAYLTWIRRKLGSATLWLRDEVKAAYPGTLCTVLFYTPTVSNPLSPMLNLVDFPAEDWASPAWDFIQVEDYEVIEFGNFTQQRSDLDVPIQALGYPLSDCQYFSGFNLLPATTFIWDKIDQAIWVAKEEKDYPKALVWARPQVCRDGWVYNEDDWPTYAEVTPAPVYPEFPNLIQLGWEVTRSPEFNTLVSAHTSGKEIRSPRAVYPLWEFELRYEGLKSDESQTYQTMLSFFQSRKGRGNRFIFEDPENKQVTAQFLGTGTGFRRNFTLVRSIGPYEEPVGAINTVSGVYANGVLQDPGTYTIWYNDTWPQVLFNTAPAEDAVITATFSYYFVCRFYEDTQSFEEFMNHFHSLRRCHFVSVKP